MRIKAFLFLLGVWLIPFAVMADDTVRLTPVQIVVIAGKMLEQGKFADAKVLLTKTSFADREIETERRYLLGGVAIKEGRLDDAVVIFRKLLNDNPRLAKVRVELALIYMAQKSWYHADYHLRLAAAEKLPAGVDEKVEMLRWVVRQNKQWNAWISFGMAPDSNVNNSQTGTQCVKTAFGVLCNRLQDPEKSVGVNIGAGGNYEFKLGEHWRMRFVGGVVTTMYDKSRYDDTYFWASGGPKYIWDKGEVWIAAKYADRQYGHNPYSSSIGGLINAGYDFSRRFSLYWNAGYDKMRYDDYGDILNGSIKTTGVRAVYSINSALYLVGKTSVAEEKTKSRNYSNNRVLLGVGLGAELPAGYSLYVEPSAQWVTYEKPSWFVQDYRFVQMREHDFIMRYEARLSNKKLAMFGLTPELTFAYTDKSSNVWQKEYKKYTLEMTLIQNF